MLFTMLIIAGVVVECLIWARFEAALRAKKARNIQAEDRAYQEELARIALERESR